MQSSTFFQGVLAASLLFCYCVMINACDGSNGNCEFDENVCNYRKENGNGVSWKRKSGHMEIVKSLFVKYGAKAKLVSPILTSSTKCMKFLYLMWPDKKAGFRSNLIGSNIGTLNVYIKQLGSNSLKKIWTLTNVQYIEYLPAEVPLNLNTDGMFQVVFEYISSTSSQLFPNARILVDSVTMTKSPCAILPVRAKPVDLNVRLARIYSYHVNLPRTLKHYGVVKVLQNGTWGFICDNSWTIEDATVVCRMLGFTGAEKALEMSSDRFPGKVWLHDVQCGGDEKTISDCSIIAGLDVHQCAHGQYAAVLCKSDCNAVPQYGSCDFSNYSTCGYTIDNQQDGITWILLCDFYDINSCIMKIHTNSSVKPGAKTKLTSPMLQPSTKCLKFSYKMLLIDAFNKSLFESNIGTLSVYMNTMGSTSLQKVWTLSGPQNPGILYAEVPLKRSENKPFQVVFEYAAGDNSEGWAHIGNIQMFNCSCETRPFKAKPNLDDVKVRLRGGKSNMEGRAEVFADGSWGTFAGRRWHWGPRSARVICRQLKFAGAVRVHHGSYFGKSTVNGPVWSTSTYNYPTCKSNETNIGRCLHKSSIRMVDSNHVDVGVECFDARLVGGNSPNEGRVEINYKGKWGTVCNKGWNIKAAHVICRDLGYRRAKRLSSFGQGKGEIRLSDVKCKGNEESISLCSYRGWVVKHCNHSQDVGVVCAD